MLNDNKFYDNLLFMGIDWRVKISHHSFRMKIFCFENILKIFDPFVRVL